jgi:hypothetical protein
MDMAEVNEVFTLIDCFIEGVFKRREFSIEPVRHVAANVLISLLSNGKCGV